MVLKHTTWHAKTNQTNTTEKALHLILMIYHSKM